MTAPRDHPFYVGYRTDNPVTQSRFTRRIAATVCCAALTIGTALALLMQPFDKGVFEFGSARTLTGRISLDGQPRLLLDAPLDRPDAIEPGAPYSELLLVQLGKFGAAAAVAELDGASVEVRGTLIAKGPNAMLELAETPTRSSNLAPALRPQSTDAQPRLVTLVGEIVDSKCFLGVMKPGRGKSHRSCAALCLEGGIPPAFLVRPDPLASGASGPADQWIALLLNPEGQPITEDLASFVGYPVQIKGYFEDGGASTVPRLLIDPKEIKPTE